MVLGHGRRVGFELTENKLMDYYARWLEQRRVFREIGKKPPFAGLKKAPRSRIAPGQHFKSEPRTVKHGSRDACRIILD